MLGVPEMLEPRIALLPLGAYKQWTTSSLLLGSAAEVSALCRAAI